ncbi:MAG: efflux transporter outer membrane subunit, partial [Planctomycetaceae bacterium]|nr:efflux transporter outer membrane subunit [Planctomycetaceae bacterium]
MFAGCTSFGEYVHNGFKVGPNYVRPPAQTSPDWIDSSDARVKSDPPADCAWWTVLNDPALNGLIGSAYRQNLDLRAAGARITEARAQRAIAVGTLFPQTQTMTISALESQISQNLPIPFPQNFDLVTAGFNGSWELDFWGRYRRAVESADANLSASVEQYGEVLVLLLSDVASNYVQLRTFQQRLAYARQNVEIQRGSLKLAETRLKQGVSSELDVRQARAILWQTESLVPVFEAGVRQSSNALCVLLGMSPIDLASALGTAPIPMAPPSVALGVPNDLLARRPDVRRAERRVAEQCARIGMATADLYPALSVNGYVGFWAQNTHELFNGDSFTGALIPRFNWNVLNYGRIANNIIAQDARLQAVAYDYQQTVLRAGQEVEDGLTRFLHAQMQARFLDRSVADTARAVELVKVQFEGGTTDFNRVFTLQASLTSQQDQLAAAQGNIALSLIAVYKGLGGGWRCFQACGGMPAPCYPPEVETVPPPPAPELLPPPPPALSPSGQTPVQVAHHVAP